MYKCYIVDKQVLQRQNLLIDERKTNEPNPLHVPANIRKMSHGLTHTQTQYIQGQYDDSINIQVSPSLNKQLYLTYA